ncbi:hypothetical protein PPYR_04256 [Photinus pyralis]|uniref:DDE-1 domain-containing protein n=1 Tax=Photinus pyralis TaxID=7054 RepID=A0A5N4AY25_PHOPY|nr:hypothetical protein PPYR_04256 [Photinus pyralis]
MKFRPKECLTWMNRRCQQSKGHRKYLLRKGENRKNAKSELTDDAPTGTLQLCQESGWMTGPLFHKWLLHFIKYTDASIEKKVLLILDGHSSHKYLDALETAKANGVIILCTPPHCTHRIQPLDVAFFGPLSTYYNQSISGWLKNNPGRTVSVYQVGKLFGEAYEKAAVMKNAVSGFKNTGIYPLNPHIFPDWMYAPAEVTDIEGLEIEPAPSGMQASQTMPYEEISQPEPCENYSLDSGMNQSSTSAVQVRLERTPSPQHDKGAPEEGTKKNGSRDRKHISLEMIKGLPKAQNAENKRKRRSQGPLVLNSTPNLAELKDKAETKKTLEARRSMRRQKATINLNERHPEYDKKVKRIHLQIRMITKMKHLAYIVTNFIRCLRQKRPGFSAKLAKSGVTQNALALPPG